jgi:diaminopimelate decarboxylase
MIFSGVAKDREELEAALAHGIYQINCERFEELQLLHQICTEKETHADVALRLNIHLTAPTHAHVQTATPESKFGIDITQLPAVLAWMRDKKSLRLKAIATHIGSQIEDLSVFENMSRQMGQLYRDLKGEGFPLERLDLGGGLGIDYREGGEGDLVKLDEYLRRLMGAHGTDAKILLEPGRFLVARMGVLLSRVIYVKKTSTQQFMILNAGMNCLMRPALYQAYHRISPLNVSAPPERYTVVGPICESTDKFAVDREIAGVKRGDWVGIFDTGAYGAAMANTYNESPLPHEWSWLDGRWEIT